jgi:hypothetical protein
MSARLSMSIALTIRHPTPKNADPALWLFETDDRAVVHRREDERHRYRTG